MAHRPCFSNDTLTGDQAGRRCGTQRPWCYASRRRTRAGLDLVVGSGFVASVRACWRQDHGIAGVAGRSEQDLFITDLQTSTTRNGNLDCRLGRDLVMAAVLEDVDVAGPPTSHDVVPCSAAKGELEV